MANSTSSGEYYEYATVDTLPPSEDVGFFTNVVSIREIRKKKNIDKIYFSIREAESDPSYASEASDITVKLQFMCPGDEGWTDYVDLNDAELAIGNRIEIEDIAAGVLWRAGVIPDDFASGQIRFGFDW